MSHKILCEGCKERLGINTRLGQRFPERHNNSYYLSISGTQVVYNVLKQIYENAPMFCLERKKKSIYKSKMTVELLREQQC